MTKFFDECIVVIPKGTAILEANVASNVLFYISDLADIASFNQIEYFISVKDGRNVTNLTELLPIDMDNNTIEIVYTPSAVTSSLYFTFKVTTDSTVHWVESTAFKVVKTGVA